MKLPPELQAFEITNPKFWHHPVSSTFHGRDIFAPVAAHISLGIPLNELGQAIACVSVFPLPRPQPDANGNLIGHILHIDHFGNLITDITSRDMPSGKFRIEVAGHKIGSLSQSYEQAQELLALIGSSGRLEIALKSGSAARLLGSKVGDELRLLRQPKRRGDG
jgi:S-adenosylmethionine hydrolase